ncbi:MAG: hypothetical protein K0R18_26 [Bacillales bacterium]|jgi:hypothetical protein|nr:hypothetical protein [Bacillales bacterium]
MNLGRIDNEHTNFDFEEIPYAINIAGVTWENRQDVVAQLIPSYEVVLQRDYNNQHDKNAIAVKMQNGNQVGWIPKRHAETLASEMDAGIPWRARVDSILGDEQQFKGVLIKLFISQPDVI